MNSYDITSMREFCNQMLDIYISKSQNNAELNKKVKKTIHEEYESNMHLNDEFSKKIKYGLSTGLKFIVSLLGFGQFVTFESYKNYKNSHGLSSKMDIYDNSINIAIDYDESVAFSARKAKEMINKSDKLTNLFYNYIVSHEEIINLRVLFDGAMKEIKCPIRYNVREMTRVSPQIFDNNIRTPDDLDEFTNKRHTYCERMYSLLDNERKKVYQNVPNARTR